MRSVFAYLDPVTGSALMQVALGALAAIGLGWQYIRRGFRAMMARFRGEAAGEPPRKEESAASANPPS